MPPTTERERLARIFEKGLESAVGTVLREFFALSADGWRQKRCDDEIERCQAKTDSARSAADRRWQVERDASASARQQSEDAIAMRTHMRTHPKRMPCSIAMAMLSISQ